MYVCMYIGSTCATPFLSRTPAPRSYTAGHPNLHTVHYMQTYRRTLHMYAVTRIPSVLDMSLREQGDFATTQPRAREAEFLAPGLRVSAFDCGEVLREARGDVGCFCEGELFCPVCSVVCLSE